MNKKHDSQTWMLTYGNLMTILMIFFLILYIFSLFGGSNFEQALAFLQKEVATDKTKAQQIFKETEIAQEVDKKLKGIADVEINAQRIKITLPSPVLFDPGKADLKLEAIKTLKGIATAIAPLKNKVIIEGHTDNVPLGSGSKYSSNWELSAARAFSVIKFFVEEEKIQPERFTAYGFAEFHPVAPNDSEQNRTKNRRIEISILREK